MALNKTDDLIHIFVRDTRMWITCQRLSRGSAVTGSRTRDLSITSPTPHSTTTANKITNLIGICCRFLQSSSQHFNSLMGSLKLQSNGPLYSNAVTGTLAVDGWMGLRVGLRGLRPRPVPSRVVPNVTAHPSTASVPTSYYSMWHYNCLCTPTG